MSKWLWVIVGIFPAFAWANVDFNEKSLVGKWQCHISTKDGIDKQMVWHFNFLSNGVVNEVMLSHQGGQGDYTYQTERLTAKANWQFSENQIRYQGYQIQSYAIRMPNADKYDLVQAELALNQSLPIIDKMVGDINAQKVFDIDVTNKKSFVMHDGENRRLLSCQKRNWLSGLFS